MQALVIDGSRAARTSLKRALQDLGGWPVFEAADREAALASLAKESETELVAVAASLPQGGAADVVRAVRARPEAPPVKILVVADSADAAAGRAALAAGADALLARPFAEDALEAQLVALGLGPPG